MTWLGRILGQSGGDAPSDRIRKGPDNLDSDSRATPDRVYANTVVQRCVQLKSAQAASVLCSNGTLITDQDGNEVRRPNVRRALTVAVGTEPAEQFWRDMFATVETHGNALARVDRGRGTGGVIRLHRVPVGDVEVEVTPSGLVYHVKGGTPVFEADMLHLRYAYIGPDTSPAVRRERAGVYAYGARSAVRDLARHVFVIDACDRILSLWARGGRDDRRALLTIPPTGASATDVTRMLELWDAADDGSSPRFITADKAEIGEIPYEQVLKVRDSAVYSIAGYYGVPPTQLGFSSGLAGTGIDALSWQPWLFAVRALVEAAAGQVERRLLRNGEFVAYDRARLLLGNPAGLQKMLPSLAGVLTVEEVRRYIGLPNKMQGTPYGGMSGAPVPDDAEEERDAQTDE